MLQLVLPGAPAFWRSVWSVERRDMLMLDTLLLLSVDIHLAVEIVLKELLLPAADVSF